MQHRTFSSTSLVVNYFEFHNYWMAGMMLQVVFSKVLSDRTSTENSIH